MGTLVAAIDQGTTSSRTLLVDADGVVRGQAQQEHRQIFPGPGLVEHDPAEILLAVTSTFHRACEQAGVRPNEVAGLGITNQRETTVLWDRATLRPVHNALVWQDTRTRELCSALERAVPSDELRHITGLPAATYFSGPKLRWLLDHAAGARAAAACGELAFGTIDTWLLSCLTGNHATDVTNASRTLLMDLRSLDWSGRILDALDIPEQVLPRIVASTPSGGFGTTRRDGPLRAEIPVLAVLGDQQAALVGQGCLRPGEIKNTYGTGCFLLLNTGQAAVPSRHGLLTTLAYQWADAAPVYALEGSVAVAGALVQWLRDSLGIVTSAEELDALASTVPDSAGVTVVPAFSGLFAPWWDSSARGTICGLTRHTTRAHICRAALEAVALQTLDLLDAMRADAPPAASPANLKVDGGMTRSALFLQIQADLAQLPVTAAASSEATALGAAYATLRALGVAPDDSSMARLPRPGKTYRPENSPSLPRLRRHWQHAVNASRGWES
jgi:glycerol kinase